MNPNYLRSGALIFIGLYLGGLGIECRAEPVRNEASKASAAVVAQAPLENIDLLLARLWRMYQGESGTPTHETDSIWQTLKPGDLLNFVESAASLNQGAFVGESGVYRESELDLVYSDAAVSAANQVARRHLFEELGVIAAQPQSGRFNSKLGPALVNIMPNGVTYFPLAQVKEGLRVAAKFGPDGVGNSDASARALFLQASNIPPQGFTLPALILPQKSETQIPAPGIFEQTCSAAPGTMTPCNNEVAVFWGRDHNNFLWVPKIGFKAIQGMLLGLGYTLTEIDARNPWLSTDGKEALFSALASGQTVIFNVHGLVGGGMRMQCYSDIAGFEYFVPTPGGPGYKIATQACCERLKVTGVALGISAASTMNCAPADPLQRPSMTPDGSLFLQAPGYDAAISYWSDNYCFTGSGNPGSPPVQGPDANRCQINGAQNLFSALGEKSVLATAQCFGAACFSSPNVGDLIGFSNHVNYAIQEICDDAQLQSDLTGQAVYCRDPDTSWQETGAISAVKTTCTGDKDVLYPAAPSTFRNIQTSIQTRGAIAPQGEVDHQTISLNCSQLINPNNGFIRYEQAGVGGQSTQKIEFAPSVLSALLSGHTLTLVFTSRVESPDPAGNFEVALSDGIQLKQSAEPYFQSPTISETGLTAALEFTENIDFLDQTEWEDEPEKLSAKYGHSQNDWPWRVEVKSKIQAPNSIPLIGNKAAPKKWIWGSKAQPNMIPPYLYSLGAVKQGGDTFEIWLPVRPAATCCMPQVDWQADMCADANEPPSQTPTQNGCSCTRNVTKDQCFVGACDLGAGPSFAQPGLKPEQCPGTYTRFDGSWKEWADCCGGLTPADPFSAPACAETVVQSFNAPEPDNCSVLGLYLSQTIKYQYQDRPWDRSAISHCPTISNYSWCADPKCPDPSWK